MEKFIFDIVSDNHRLGNGFIIDDMFITAGHVSRDVVNPRIRINDQLIELGVPLYDRFDDNEYGYDIAVYHVPQFHSPLQLMVEEPVINQVMISMSYNLIPEGLKFYKCEAVVCEPVQGNYFGVNTQTQLSGGASGSPLFYEGKVSGMLCRGNLKDGVMPCDPEHLSTFCAYHTAQSIQKAINECTK